MCRGDGSCASRTAPGALRLVVLVVLLLGIGEVRKPPQQQLLLRNDSKFDTWYTYFKVPLQAFV